MAYESKHLRRMGDMGGIVRGSTWVLDTIDATASVDTAGYITDAAVKGMQKGDLVLVRRWTTAVPSAASEVTSAAGSANILLGIGWHAVLGMSAAGAADLTDVTAIAVTNTD